jgi:serine/threonine protein kinase
MSSIPSREVLLKNHVFQTSSYVVRLWHIQRHAPVLSCPVRQYWNVRLPILSCLLNNTYLFSLHSLEYSSPESLPSPRTGVLHHIDSKSDMWSLGMILHKLLFFRLPYMNVGEEISADDGEKMVRLENEILNYTGCDCPLITLCLLRIYISRFKSTIPLVKAFETRRLPRAFLVLLESLLNTIPSARPSCERVSSAIREGRVSCLSFCSIFRSYPPLCVTA